MIYRIVTEQELAVRKGEIILSFDEMAELIAIKDILFKLVDKTIRELRLANGNGVFRGKEEYVYAQIDGFEEFKKSIEKTEENMRIYKRKKEAKE